MIGPFRSDVRPTSKFFSTKGHKTAALNVPSSMTSVLKSDDNLYIHNMGSQLRLKGYIQNVSPIIKTHATDHSFPYFNFSLQISDSTTRRAICYDPRKQKLLKRYQHSREPATFTNITEKRSLLDSSQDEIIVTKRSRIEPANNNDIPFEYSEDSTSQNPQMLTALHKVASLNDKQIISVKGAVTLCPEYVQQVTTKNGATINILDRCVITDNTATVRLVLWGHTVNEVTNHASYIITNVRVKNFDSTNYLTTISSTVITTTEDRFPLPTAQAFNDFFDPTTIFVRQISLVDNFKRWFSCTNCARSLSQPTSITTTATAKCPSCKATQRISSCNTKTSVRIAVRRDNNNDLIWLTAFNPIFKQMLEHPPGDVSLQSPEEEIYSQLFKLENFTVEYSEASSVIKNIYF